MVQRRVDNNITSWICAEHHILSLWSWGVTFSSWQKFNPTNNLIRNMLICFVYVLLNSTQLIWMSSSISRNSFLLAKNSSAARHTVCWQEYTWLLERTWTGRRIFSDQPETKRIEYFQTEPKPLNVQNYCHVLKREFRNVTTVSEQSFCIRGKMNTSGSSTMPSSMFCVRG